MADPFHTLGLARDATADDIRQARRALAKQHHPDTGGDTDQMRALNLAAAAALRIRAEQHPGQSPPDAATSEGPEGRDGPDDGGLTSDVPSFTVEALPAETFDALLVVAAEIGEVIDDEPPYRLDVLLHAGGVVGHTCWCRLELVPDAGASTVSLGVARYAEHPLPSITDVRDEWVAQLNRHDWG